MPYICTKVSTPLSNEKEVAIKSQLGAAISAFPGKSENWLMCEFASDCKLWFKGTNDKPTAFVEVSIFGGEAPSLSYDTMTSKITAILESELSIPADRIYVKYESSQHWGYNGSNF